MDAIGIAATIIAAVAAVVSIYAAVLSRRSAGEAKAAIENRARRRAVLGDVLDAGHRLLEDVRANARAGFPPEQTASIDKRFQEWMAAARAAVEIADRAQLARFNAFVEAPALDVRLAVQLERLQEIQDRI